MDNVLRSPWFVILGVIGLLVLGGYLFQKSSLAVPASVRFVSPFHYDAIGSDSQHLEDEYFTLRNLLSEPIDMTAWTVANKVGTVFVFPEGFVLPSQGTVTIYSGCGVNTDSELYCCSDRPIWNNQSDTAALRDEEGKAVDRHSYFRACISCAGGN